MNTCPGLDTAVYPCWIPRETRHGTREKHIIRGVHLKEPVRCYWRKTNRGTHLRLCFLIDFAPGWELFFYFFIYFFKISLPALNASAVDTSSPAQRLRIPARTRQDGQDGLLRAHHIIFPGTALLFVAGKR